MPSSTCLRNPSGRRRPTGAGGGGSLKVCILISIGLIMEGSAGTGARRWPSRGQRELTEGKELKGWKELIEWIGTREWIGSKRYSSNPATKTNNGTFFFKTNSLDFLALIATTHKFSKKTARIVPAGQTATHLLSHGPKYQPSKRFAKKGLKIRTKTKNLCQMSRPPSSSPDSGLPTKATGQSTGNGPNPNSNSHSVIKNWTNSSANPGYQRSVPPKTNTIISIISGFLILGRIWALILFGGDLGRPPLPLIPGGLTGRTLRNQRRIRTLPEE